MRNVNQLSNELYYERDILTSFIKRQEDGGMAQLLVEAMQELTCRCELVYCKSSFYPALALRR